MPTNNSFPIHGEGSFNCPRCGALAGQEFGELYAETEHGQMGVSDRTFVPEDVPWAPDTTWSRSFCFACKESSLWIGPQLVFPDPSSATERKVPERSEDLPASAAKLYDEAVAVLPHSRRAAAALCRAAMEQLAKHLTPELPSGVKLDGRLVALSKTVSTATLQALNIVRHVGNTALHGEKDGDESAVMYLNEDDSAIAEVFFLAINALADEKITQPRRIQNLYETLPETIRNSFEAKTAVQ